jgi:hypothetical protein
MRFKGRHRICGLFLRSASVCINVHKETIKNLEHQISR